MASRRMGRKGLCCKLARSFGHLLLSQRLRIGSLELDPALGPGQWRELTRDEIKALRKAAGMEQDAGVKD